MKARILTAAAIFGLLTFGPGSVSARPAQAQTPADPSAAALRRLFVLQEKVRDLHPAFEILYPVAVVEGGRFHVYEPDMEKRIYRPAADAADTFNVPAGVRAAMPLDFWGNRIACVVTPEVFAETGGYAVILHEFVHCFQWGTCEPRLKDTLAVYAAAVKRNDFMWEIQHPFPYEDADFRRNYEEFMAAVTGDDLSRAGRIRAALKAGLSRENWEYLTWQEWKEGTARYLENEIKARLGLPANTGGAKPPFTRVSFYAGGERFIRALESVDPGIVRDLEALYRRIAE